MCPSSAAPPDAPRTSCPPQTIPPPMPVPTVSITASSQPTAAPWRHSASIAQLRVVVDRDGNAEPLLHERLERDALERQVRAGGDDAGRARSSTPGMPKPAPSTGPGAASAASRTIAASVSSSSVVLEPLRAALGAVMHGEAGVDGARRAASSPRRPPR